ncbi:MAG: choice-of-anchor D domain-containing protein, partial [Candidatus Latescibacterota bacterium]
MTRLRSYRTLLAIAVIAVGSAFVVEEADAATFNIINLDGPGEGFNDPTPVSPVGGNPGTTLGQQRLNCFIRAGEIWGAILQSNVTVSIDANMDPMFCNATSAVLGSAGPNTVHRNHSGAPLASTWYVQAEANSHAGTDLAPSDSDGTMTFNSNLDGSESCLGGSGWYLGFDESPPPGDIDFVTVLVHEMGHVLGFLTLMNSNGTLFYSGHDAYERLMYHDGASPPDYPSMTNVQRAAGNIGDPNLVFDGLQTNQRAAAIPLSAGVVNGRTRLHGPNPYQSGSSLSHFSSGLVPNQIMEPFYTGPDHSPDLDIQLMKDIGWTLLTNPPSCSVTPASLNFGTVTVGSSADDSFTITNTGGGTLSGSVSESCADYSIVSGGGSYSLGAGQSRVVTVRFEPLTPGVKPCTIETGDALCADVTCLGTGEAAPVCLVTPTSLDFGTVAVGSSAGDNFTIKNTGGGTLSGTVSESCADYDILSGGGPYTLAAGESLQVIVKFEPLSSGVKPCTIETGDALCSDVTCTGTGDDPPVCSVEPTSLDFGTVAVGNSADDTFTIKNTGGGTVSGTVSESCDDYDLVSGGGPYTLAAGESLQV